MRRIYIYTHVACIWLLPMGYIPRLKDLEDLQHADGSWGALIINVKKRAKQAAAHRKQEDALRGLPKASSSEDEPHPWGPYLVKSAHVGMKLYAEDYNKNLGSEINTGSITVCKAFVNCAAWREVRPDGKS